MRLGTGLIIAFLAVAFIPASAILGFTWVTVEGRFQEEFEERLDGVSAGIQSEMQQIGVQLKQKVETLSASEDIERILVDMLRGTLDRPALIPQAGKWMRAWGFDLLSILDGEGTVLSCGHLPARYGSVEENFVALISDKPNTPVIQQVQVLRDGSISNILAVVIGEKRKFHQAEVIIFGGKLLDEKFVQDLESLSGAKIQILSKQEMQSSEGPENNAQESSSRRVASDEVNYRKIPILPDNNESASAFIVAGVSNIKLLSAQRRILLASVGAAVIGVIISWLLGLLISRKIVRPVHSLVDGARRIARGDLGQGVSGRFGGEMGELVLTFNSMIDDLAVYRKKLIRAERVAAWQEIARRIAHEIKNPLSPIQMSIETLRKAYSSGHQEFKEIFNESTQAILEEVAALKKIVTEFSEFARLPKPSTIVQNLNEVIENTIGLYRNQEGGDKLRYVPGERMAKVAVDREQIGRVVGNLLSNAFWATRSKGTIAIFTEQRESRVLLRVVDSGVGMTKETLEKIFTPYFTTRQEGTGLGLAIVQRIVEDHEGIIEIESTEGEGTTVNISFPACEL